MWYWCVAADYTRTIIFKVEDQAIKRATDRITRSLKNIEDSLGRLERKGFGNIAKGADQAAKSIDRVSKATTKLQQIDRATKLGVGLGGLGLGTAAGIKGWNEFAGSINNVLSPLTALVPAIKAPTIALGSFGAVGKAAAIVAGSKLTPVLGALAVAYMALGDKTLPIIKKTAGLINGFGQLANTAGSQLTKGLNQAALSFSPLRTEIEWTTQALLKLDERFKTPRGVITSRNRAFGIRQQGTPVEEEVRMRNRAINQRAAEHRQARRSLAIEKKRSQVLEANIRRQEKLLTGFSANQYGPQPAPLTLGERLGFGRGADRRGVFASSKGVAGRLGNAGQSALIGGGFPLLFGQSPVAAAAGGVGGGLGGLLGGGFGFAGSIVATAAAQKIQEAIEYRKEIEKLNVSIRETGGTSVFTASQISSLSKEMNLSKEETLAAVSAFSAFDASQRTLLAKVYGDPSSFKLYASISKDANTLISAIEPLMDANEISIEQAKKTLDVLNKGGLIEAQQYLERLKEEKELSLEIQKINKITQDDRNKAQAVFSQYYIQDEYGRVRSLGILEKMTEVERERVQLMMTDEYFRDQRVQKLINQNEQELSQNKELLELRRNLTRELERQSIIQAPADELERLLDPLTQVNALATAIGESFSGSFKGIVKGTMTAQQALANMFERTADMFLDMAAQILQAQIKARILGIFAGSFTRGTTGSTETGLDLESVQHYSDTAFRAEGGPVTGGNPYVVGEKGPELFVPNSSGNIIPNGSYGGVGSVVVNVDASGSEVQGDEEDAAALGRMIGAAVQAELIRQKRPGGILAR